MPLTRFAASKKLQISFGAVFRCLFADAVVILLMAVLTTWGASARTLENTTIGLWLAHADRRVPNMRLTAGSNASTLMPRQLAVHGCSVDEALPYSSRATGPAACNEKRTMRPCAPQARRTLPDRLFSRV